MELVCPHRPQKLIVTRKKGEMPEKTLLHKVYENTLGVQIDFRTMRRIRNQYLQGEANLKTVKTLALLRRANGNAPLRLEDVQRYEWLSDFADGVEGWVQGSDLLASLNRLDPAPCPRTIYNWGNEIGVPLRATEWYSPQQVQAWIRKLARQTRFKMPQRQGV
jgi:hypothetical protein